MVDEYVLPTGPRPRGQSAAAAAVTRAAPRDQRQQHRCCRFRSATHFCSNRISRPRGSRRFLRTNHRHAIRIRPRAVASILLSPVRRLERSQDRAHAPYPNCGGSMKPKSFVSMFVCLPVLTAACSLLLARPAAAQSAPDPNPGSLTVTSSIDLTNVYMFRGIRQDDTKVMIWPALDLGLSVFALYGALKSAALDFGSGWSGSKASLTFPVKVGLSLANYYELNGVDNRFGYFSAAGIGSVPLKLPASFGAWNVHAGVEFQQLGTTTKAFNNGDAQKVIVSGGIGLTY